MRYTAVAMHRAKYHAFAVLLALGSISCLGPEPTAQLTVWAPSGEELAQAAPQPAEPACAAVEPLDVLFIGNSYVIQSDTPGLLQAMAEDAGVEFNVERLAQGGKNFEYHLERSRTHDVLEKGDWDVVFLQSHSLDPLRNTDGFAEAGEALIEEVREAGAEPWLFETWARREGHNLYNYMDEVGETPAEMQKRVTAQYEALADETNVPVAKVGTAWLELKQEHPEVKPYLKDGAHPAEAGAYLSAAVVFTHLTERDPRGVLQPHGAVDERTAGILQDIAAEVVSPPCQWE
jgi:uncharacterized protein YuzB (UPF0349 family)